MTGRNTLLLCVPPWVDQNFLAGGGGGGEGEGLGVGGGPGTGGGPSDLRFSTICSILSIYGYEAIAVAPALNCQRKSFAKPIRFSPSSRKCEVKSLPNVAVP